MRRGSGKRCRMYTDAQLEYMRAANRCSYRKHHAERRATYRQQYAARRALIDGLKNHPCQDCGNSYPSYVMEFHHRDPATKVFKVAVALVYYSLNKVFEEIAKCDLLCANCHRIREWGENGLRRRTA